MQILEKLTCYTQWWYLTYQNHLSNKTIAHGEFRHLRTMKQAQSERIKRYFLVKICEISG